MITDLKPYPAMKDSGVPWLGEVPEHWEVRRLKRLVELNPSKSEAGRHLYAGVPAVFLPMERVGSDGRIDCSESRPVSEAWSGLTYFRRNDVIVAKITPCFENGKGACLTALPTEVGFGSTEFHVLRPSGQITPQFLYRITTLADFRRLGAEAMTGAAGQQRVPRSFIEQFQPGIPPLPDQAAIVRFLDYADRRIRRYVRAKQKLIKLLEEQKQTIIHRAVTRGLDPNVRLKPSRVEWLGDVPEHWEVKRLKTLVTEAVAGPYGSSLTKAMYTQQGYRVYGQQQVIPDDFAVGDYYISADRFQEMLQYRVSPGDVLVSVMGTIGRTAVVPDAAEPGIINPRLVRYRPDFSRVRSRYLQLAMQSQPSQAQFAESAKGTTMDGLNMRILGTLRVAVPPLTEQDAILACLPSETAEILSASSAAQREISLLREYRTRLIADVVTGKLDVREAAALLPDEADEREQLDDADGLPGDDEVGDDVDLDGALEEVET